MDDTETSERLLVSEEETTTDELDDYDLDSESTEYDYSQLKDLWDKYYSEVDTEDESLYSTTGFDLSDTDSIESFIKSGDFTAFIATFASIMIIGLIISLLYGIYMAIVNFMISKKMGRGTGFAIASIFFWPIMGGILAFSKNKALENATKPASTEPITPKEPEAPTAQPEA